MTSLDQFIIDLGDEYKQEIDPLGKIIVLVNIFKAAEEEKYPHIPQTLKGKFIYVPLKKQPAKTVLRQPAINEDFVQLENGIILPATVAEHCTLEKKPYKFRNTSLLAMGVNNL